MNRDLKSLEAIFLTGMRGHLKICSDINPTIGGFNRFEVGNQETGERYEIIFRMREIDSDNSGPGSPEADPRSQTGG